MIDCAGLDASAVKSETDKLKDASDDGADMSKAYDVAIGDLESVGWKIAGCALVEIAEDVFTKAGATPTGNDKAAVARNSVSKFKTEHANGASFKTARGTL